MSRLPYRTFLNGLPAEGGLVSDQVVVLALLQRAVLDAEGVRVEGVSAPRVEFTVAMIALDGRRHWNRSVGGGSAVKHIRWNITTVSLLCNFFTRHNRQG